MGLIRHPTLVPLGCVRKWVRTSHTLASAPNHPSPPTVDGPVKSCHPLTHCLAQSARPAMRSSRDPCHGASKRSRVLRMFAMVVVLWIDTGTVDETASTSLYAPPTA